MSDSRKALLFISLIGTLIDLSLGEMVDTSEDELEDIFGILGIDYESLKGKSLIEIVHVVCSEFAKMEMSPELVAGIIHEQLS